MRFEASRLVLVEEPPGRVERRDGDLVVAMTARACHRLELDGVPHVPIAEIASEAELARLEQAHWGPQLAWLEDLDRRLADAVGPPAALGIGAATLWAYYLKICLDIVFIRAFEADALLALAPSEVVLHTRNAEEPPLDHTLFFRGPSVLARVLPVVAEARGVPLRIERSRPAVPADVRSPFGRRTLARLARLRRRRPVGARPSTGGGPTILLLHRGYDLDHLAVAVRDAGGRCLDLADLAGPAAAPPPDALWRDVAEAIAADAAVWSWPDSWFDAPVSRVLAPRFAHWIGEVLPAVAAEAPRFARAYRDERVDFVATPFLSTVSDAAALAAARTSARTRSVVIQHGDDVFDGHSWDVHYLLAYDEFFTTSGETARHFEARAQGLAPRRVARPHVGSYRWQALAAAGPAQRAPGDKPLVVYVIAPMHRDTRYLNTGTYGDTWYWGVQRAIVDSFIGDDRYRFLVKLFPGDPERSLPLSDYVADLAPHVTTSTHPFVQVLPSADRVIVDTPSTSLYEAALAGVPVLGLVGSHVPVRPGAADRFGAALVAIETPSDAAAAVTRFLGQADPAPVDLRPEGDDIYATLMLLAGEGR